MHSRHSYPLPAVAGALLWFALSPASGQTRPEPETLETISVIGSRAPQTAEQVLGDVTVIHREEIERAGHSSLVHLLSASPGVESLNYGGPQTPSSIFLRGSNSNQTLVLLDGQRINSATSGGSALNAIALADIERIEILRGAAGSLYGADAVGGVVNIITRQDADRPLAVSGSIGYGTRGTSRANASLAGRNAGWRYALNLGYGQSRGYNSTEPGSFSYNPDRDSYYQRSASGTLGYSWRQGHEVALQAFHSTVNGGYDSAPDFNDRAIQRVEGYSLTSRDQITDFWHSTLRVGFTRDHGRNENAPAALNPFNTEDGISTFVTRQNQYGWQNDFQLSPNQRLMFAVERLEQRVSGDLSDWMTASFVNYEVTRRDTNSVTGVYAGDFGRHHLQASLRRDHDSQYGGETTGGAAYGFDILPGLRATLSGSTAFRAPTFNELYYPNGGYAGLRPEKSRNLEAGLRYLSGDTELGVTLYRNRISNLITGWPVENIGKAVLEGATFTAAQRFGNTGLRASLDIQNPHDDATGDLLPLRAKRIFRLSGDHRIGQLSLGADWYVSSERYGSAREHLGGYGLVDLSAAYDLNAQTRIQVRWNNVFDKNYTVVPGYRTEGSSIFVSLNYRPRY